MDKEKKYFKELKKKVDIYFVIILSMLLSSSVYMITEMSDKNKNNLNLNFIILIIYICLVLYLFSIRNNNKSKNINELDKILLSSTFSLFVLLVLLATKNHPNLIIPDFIIKEKTTLITITLLRHLIVSSNFISTILLITISMVGYRIYSYNKINKLEENIKKDKIEENTKKDKIEENSQTNNKKSYTLEDLRYANFKKNNIDKIVIKDSDDDIPDAFKIDRTKEELKIAINKYSTIGVVGEWGIGKSTIINSTIKELDENTFILIRDFDPWAIKSQDALILAMYNTIMENLGENISYFKRKKVQNALINISTNIPYIGKGIGNYFENRIDDYTEYKEIKADLEEKLKKFDKRLIFIMDNLDRMNSSNVIFLLTLIETLFKLPNITYIVAYDKNRLNKIFEDNSLDLKYLEKIINKEIFMPTLDRDILETCLENLINIYNYDLQNPKVIKLICKRFTNIRQFIYFCNSLSKKPDIFYFLKNKEDYYLDIECDYFIIQAIKFFDYNIFLKIYNDKDRFVKQTAINDYLYNNYKNYTDLISLLFCETERKIKNNSILNPILFKMCFVDINEIVNDAIDLINRLESNFIKYNQQQSEAKTQEMYDKLKESEDNEEFYQKETLIDFLNISFCSTEYDIIYSFSLIEYVIKFRNITLRQKEILWNLLIQCSSHNENSIYSYTLETEHNETLKDLIDDNIRILLNYIFQSFNKKEKKEFTKDIKGKFNHNKADYFKNLIIYECILGNYFFNLLKGNEPNYREIDDFIKDLYRPLINFPIFLWKENELLDLINKINFETNPINEIYGIFINYKDILYEKIKENGTNLYTFIEFFALKKMENNIFPQSKELERKKSKLTEKDIYILIDKFPPKDENEEKIKKDFEKKYPNK